MKKYNFEDFAATSSGHRAETLLLTHKVKPEQIFTTVLAEITQILPHLEDEGRYSTEDLCDPDIWVAWLTAERRVAGMCMAYFVRNHVVKLFRHRTPKGKGKALYCTQPSPDPAEARRIKIVRVRRVLQRMR